MEKIIHICFSQSARGSLKYIINMKKLIKGEEVIGFLDDISQGPISSGINVEERFKWFNSIVDEDEVYACDVEEFKEEYEKFYDEISKVKDGDCLYFWYGESSFEICALMYTLELLKGRLKNSYLINVSDVISEHTHGVFIPRCVGEIMPEKLSDYMKANRKLEIEEYTQLMNQWNLLKSENSLLRVLKDKEVKSVEESYFDIDILKYTEKELKKSARIVGNVLGYSETLISDAYIFWRVKELVKLGYIIYQGKFGIMREMEIKISDKGIKYLSNYPEAIEFWNKRQQDLKQDGII